MEKKLSATTKELILHKIERAKEKVKKMTLLIQKAESSDYETTKEFIEFFEIEIELIENEIEILKQMLFTK